MNVTAVTPEIIKAQYDQGAADACCAAAWLKADRRMSTLGWVFWAEVAAAAVVVVVLWQV